MTYDAEFMSGWDDPLIVTERLRPALESRGIASSIKSSVVEPLGGHSGLSGDMSLLTLTVEEKSNSDGDDGPNTKTIKFVLKRTRPTNEAKFHSKKLGLYREGTFYSTIGPLVQERLDQVKHHADSFNNDSSKSSQNSRSFIPKALFAASDPNTGQKAIVLDYFQNSIEAGLFFPHTIHNASRNLEDTSSFPPRVNQKSITLEATRIAASLHGTFYRDVSLLNNHQISQHLKMADWIQGKNQETFLASQQEVCDRWARAKEQWEKGEYYKGGVTMEKSFVDIMDASCALALDFDSFVKKWNVDSSESNDNSATTIGWSLVHSDYHPGNFLCINNSDKDPDAAKSTPELILLDWEVVGVGSGPQDIGQFLISHMKSQDAHDILDEVVSTYQQTLVETLQSVNPSQVSTVPTVEEIRKEIVYGGLERWVWLIGYMSGWGDRMPPMYMQYFIDQVHGWIETNGIIAKNVGMPRP